LNAVVEPVITLGKTHGVHLKPKGEVCNWLHAGARVHLLQRKGDWVRITWRSGKKNGWIQYPEPNR
tara:strand:- start:480 stop:677 length:198 start_codon:yes stop_codon:yes gene_type:complete